MIKPWPTIRSVPIGDFRIFKLRSDIKVSPRTIGAGCEKHVFGDMRHRL